MRQVRQIMGLPISLDIPGASNNAPFDAAFALLEDIDRQFSPYKKTSELSRYQRGALSEPELSADMTEVMRACREIEQLTRGYFSAYYDGRFDPTGYVKGWAVGRAGRLLEEQGQHTYMINAGGDILARTRTGHIWRIGLQHPTEPGKISGVVTAGNIAVATSGTYARGNHIINPATRRPATELLSVTVTGPEIAMADALATAVFAMGREGLDFIETQDGYEALVISKEMDVLMSSGFAQSTRPA